MMWASRRPTPSTRTAARAPQKASATVVRMSPERDASVYRTMTAVKELYVFGRVLLRHAIVRPVHLFVFLHGCARLQSMILIAFKFQARFP